MGLSFAWTGKASIGGRQHEAALLPIDGGTRGVRRMRHATLDSAPAHGEARLVVRGLLSGLQSQAEWGDRFAESSTGVGCMSPAESAAAILEAAGEIQIEYLNSQQLKEWQLLTSIGLWSQLAHTPATQRWLTLRTAELGRLLTPQEVCEAIVQLLGASVAQPEVQQAAPLVVQEGTDAVQ